MMNKVKYTQKGFSLVELLVVIAIMAILAAIGLSVFNLVSDNMKISKSKTLIEMLGTSLEQYYDDNGFYPDGAGDASGSTNLFTELGGFDQQGTVDEDKESYADYLNPGSKTVNASFQVVDGFETPLFYTARLDEASTNSVDPTADTNNPGFDLWSAGKNLVDDSGELDDIANWKE